MTITDNATTQRFEPAAASQPADAPAQPARWLTVGQMLSGDMFVLPSVLNGTPVEFERADFVGELHPVGMALVKVAGVEIPLTLPAEMRFRMARAIRRAAIRCLICNDESDELGEYEYDLATHAGSAIIAIGPECERSTAGTVHRPNIVRPAPAYTGNGRPPND